MVQCCSTWNTFWSSLELHLHMIERLYKGEPRACPRLLLVTTSTYDREAVQETDSDISDCFASAPSRRILREFNFLVPLIPRFFFDFDIRFQFSTDGFDFDLRFRLSTVGVRWRLQVQLVSVSLS
ncbi:hypothetical protein L6452_41244 [Arctium lappa]|uniref:Uncharacterized protein n=1 Tax=Arctium lappa TaxID=4217 RepID=A0ACB8XP56_ARCLA|nr:hypothetical protein L6452_41244 [Arctium lappa]